MPTAIHEIVTRRVAGEITRQLNSIAERNDTSGEFARNIEDSGSTHLTFPDSVYGSHDPDVRWLIGRNRQLAISAFHDFTLYTATSISFTATLLD
jgi:hypothetical protein